MISFRRTIISSDLVKSQLFDEISFYKQFTRDVKLAQQSVIIESPYVTTVRTRQFVKLFKRLKKRGVRVRIYTREPRHQPYLIREQAAESIKLLIKNGAKVYVCRDMRHRKLAIIDKQIVYEGSLNILSQSRSKEIMRRTESAQLSVQILKFAGLYTWL